MIGTPAALVALARYLLLDFDGPVCHLFAGLPARQIADELRDLIPEPSTALPEAVRMTGDPLAVLTHIARHGSAALSAEVERVLRAAETRAATSTMPTPYAARLIAVARHTGQRLAVVSNNSADAVTAYLGAHGLDRYIDVIVGRPARRPDRMKPNPWPVLAALDELHSSPDEAVLVGDSPTDVEAAHAAGVAVIGYANKPAKWTPTQANRIVTEARPHLSRIPPFTITIGPLAGSAGAVRFSVGPHEPVLRIRAAVRAAVAAVRGAENVPMRSTTYVPHVGIAYNNSQVDAQPVRQRVRGLRSEPPVTTLINTIDLVELRREERRYAWRTLHRIPLQGHR
ncbi:HAD-IA family hydrolase [Polymorphospora lycopeni]|uniref:HAD-IA family hydrolase n=1 Tax=Polymorphospora lycopeni TaxID=3140240 RepID=A0ABV5CZ40_9ACTN